MPTTADLTTHATPTHAAPSASPSSTAKLRSFRSYTYWSLVGVSALLLVLFAVTGAVPHPPDPLGIIEIAGVVTMIAAIARLAAQHIPPEPGERPLSPRAWRLWAMIGCLAAALVATVWVVAGETWLWAMPPAAVASLLVAPLPPARRRIAVAAIIGAAMVIGALVALLRGEAPVEAYLFTLTLGGALVAGFWLFMTLTTIWTWQVVVQLDDARRTAAALAVANERLRFAADLHDIQGHSLQVIALKSELAARLADSDPTTAKAEMVAVQQFAGDALRDTRSVVEGYRRTSLDAEIANATNVLGSAGIDAQLHLDHQLTADRFPEPVRHLLGLVVREAVTNVLRHSAATHATLRLASDGGSRVLLSIANDGVDREPSPGGGGLRQLATRLRSAGGQLTWERDGEWFEIRAELPTATAAETPTPERERPA